MRPTRSRQIRVLLVWLGVGCGGWRGLPVRRHSYRGHRVELCRISDWLKNDIKQLKVKRNRQTRVYLGFIRPIIRRIYFGLMAGPCGVRFRLDFTMYLFLVPNGPGMPFFGRCPLFSSHLTQFQTPCCGYNHHCIVVPGMYLFVVQEDVCTRAGCSW